MQFITITKNMEAIDFANINVGELPDCFKIVDSEGRIIEVWDKCTFGLDGITSYNDIDGNIVLLFKKYDRIGNVLVYDFEYGQPANVYFDECAKAYPINGVCVKDLFVDEQ